MGVGMGAEGFRGQESDLELKSGTKSLSPERLARPDWYLSSLISLNSFQFFYKLMSSFHPDFVCPLGSGILLSSSSLPAWWGAGTWGLGLL